MRTHGFIVLSSILLVAAMLPVFSGCTQKQTPRQTGKIGVVVTILPQMDFVENVGGDKVEVSVMVSPGSNPHIFEPTPGQMAKVSTANIYMKVGSGVEFELAGMDKLEKQNPDMPVVDCSAGIQIVDNDPHIWTSPLNAKKMVQNICEGLVKVDPANADYYRQNRDRYLSELDDLDSYIHQRLDKAANRYFMVYHPAFGYLAREYNLVELAIEEEGKSPTPASIQESIELARKHHLSYVFVAPQFSSAQAETIAKEIGGQTAVLDSLPRYYIQNMRKVADTLALDIK